jgi:hypothetical protein
MTQAHTTLKLQDRSNSWGAVNADAGTLHEMLFLRQEMVKRFRDDARLLAGQKIGSIAYLLTYR